MRTATKQGFNGSILANAGSAGRYNAGVNLNYGIRNLNFYGGYTFRRDRYDNTVDDYHISPSDTIFKRDEYVDSQTKETGGVVSASYHRDRDADAKENMWAGSLQYTHCYGNSNEISIGYVYSSESEYELNRYTTMRQDVETLNNETVWDADYIHNPNLRWKHALTDKIRLISGYEFEHLRAEQNYHVSDWDGTSIIPNTDASNDFTYLRMVHSLYANADMTFGLWCVNAGLRGEYTDIDNQLKSLAEAAEELHCYNLLVITNSQEEKIEWKRTAILMTSIQNF